MRRLGHQSASSCPSIPDILSGISLAVRDSTSSTLRLERKELAEVRSSESARLLEMTHHLVSMEGNGIIGIHG